MVRKKRPTDEVGPKKEKLMIDKHSVPRYSPLRKKREEALFFILESAPDKTICLDNTLRERLRDRGWDWHAINTAANDTVRSGSARLEHDQYPGMFRLMAVSMVEPDGEGSPA